MKLTEKELQTRLIAENNFSGEFVGNVGRLFKFINAIDDVTQFTVFLDDDGNDPSTTIIGFGGGYDLSSVSGVWMMTNLKCHRHYVWVGGRHDDYYIKSKVTDVCTGCHTEQQTFLCFPHQTDNTKNMIPCDKAVAVWSRDLLQVVNLSTCKPTWFTAKDLFRYAAWM